MSWTLSRRHVTYWTSTNPPAFARLYLSRSVFVEGSRSPPSELFIMTIGVSIRTLVVPTSGYCLSEMECIDGEKVRREPPGSKHANARHTSFGRLCFTFESDLHISCLLHTLSDLHGSRPLNISHRQLYQEPNTSTLARLGLIRYHLSSTLLSPPWRPPIPRTKFHLHTQCSRHLTASNGSLCQRLLHLRQSTYGTTLDPLTDHQNYLQQDRDCQRRTRKASLCHP